MKSEITAAYWGQRSNIPLLTTHLRPLRGRKPIAPATSPLHYFSTATPCPVRA
ncbi:MAG: hypothetical protein GX230_07685 [Lentisphaerae bacterium]|nr:hypothetical protein [Lentisphaerota bacterium]